MIRKAVPEDIDELLRMRKKLFEDCSDEELYKEIVDNFKGDKHPDYKDILTYVYERENISLGGFIDISIIDVLKMEYFDSYSNFFMDFKKESAVPCIQAWYVDEDLRGKKIGKELVKHAENWALEKGFNIILSDTDTYRETSIIAHHFMGYQTVRIIPDRELVLFLKTL